MVHALQEIHRVLDVNGILIDLRPLHDDVSLDLITENSVQSISRFTATQHIHKDGETRYSMRHAVNHGWYIAEATTPFDFERYWDSIDELRTYIDSRNPPYLFSSETLDTLVHQLAITSDNPKIRITWHMNLVQYRCCK